METTRFMLSKYLENVGRALLNFQFIEELIRIYLSNVYKIISKKLEKQVLFKFSYRDLKNDSLGKLLEKFKKFNSNGTLISKINNLTKDRNYLAHEAYLLTTEQQEDNKHLSKEIDKINRIIDNSQKCINELEEEFKKLDTISKNIQ